MIERKCEEAARCNQACGSSQRLVHGSGVMQDAPRIDHFKGAETVDISIVKDRALLDRPFAVASKIAFPQLCSTIHGFFIKVERVHTRAKFASGERRQSAT